MSNINLNPYRENIQIIKSFFSRPCVLILALVLAFINIMNTVASLFVSDTYIAGINDIFYSIPVEYRQGISLNISENTVVEINIFLVLITVALFLLYFFSRSETKSLNAPVTIIKVVSIITLILVCIALVAALALEGYILTVLSSLYNFETSVGIFMGVVIFITAVVGAVMIWYISLQLRFTNSVKKSMKSIHLYKNGAFIYGILSIIAGALCTGVLAVSLFKLLDDFTMVAEVALVALTALGYIFTGVVAIKYSRYIKEISTKFVTEVYHEPEEADDDVVPFTGLHGVTPHVPDSENRDDNVKSDDNVGDDTIEYVNPYAQYSKSIFCPECGNKVRADDMFCRNCGKKLK